MSIISRMRRQKAVWWQADGVDGYGQPSYANGVEIACRWEDMAEEFINSQGQRVLSSAVVYVDREMKVGDMLFKGELSDLSYPNDPKSNGDTFAIEQFSVLPNLRNTENLYTCHL